MEKSETKKKKKFRIPPIVLVILAVIIMGVCIGISVNVNNASKEARDFRMQASEAEAEILTKTAYTIGTDEDFVIHYVFGIAFSTDMNDDVKNFTTTIDETDQSLRTLEPGDIISIYYIAENPSDCHPASLYTDHLATYIILAIIFIGALLLAWINIDTIIRNIHGYKPLFAKPEDIGTFGDPTVDNGLSDNSIDYSAGDVFSNNLMDSYSDPFATYSGYEEGENSSPDGSYYDPNASFADSQPVVPDQNIDHGDMDLNNPFLTNINNDPNNPYNQGNFGGQ